MHDYWVFGPKIYTPTQILENHSVHIENNSIVEITHNKHPDALIFPDNYHLLAGFIDIHVHGINGKDVMDGDPQSLYIMSETLAKEGVTSFLATTMTEENNKIERALKTIAEFKNFPGAKILGVHLEGPFIAPTKAGAQFGINIQKPNIQLFEKWQNLSGNAIKIVTIAPEVPDAWSFVKYLTENNVIASIGHSDAVFSETEIAIKAGCTHATHLFNAMRGLHQREPGIVGAILLHDKIYAEVIADGIHLHPGILKLIFKIKGAEKTILVTDSMCAKCLTDGDYQFGGQIVVVKDQVPRLRDGTLAGSVLSMIDAVRNMMNFTDCDLMDATRMASFNPATSLGISAQTGSIEVGKDADLVILDENLQVVLTVCAGRRLG